MAQPAIDLEQAKTAMRLYEAEKSVSVAELSGDKVSCPL